MCLAVAGCGLISWVLVMCWRLLMGVGFGLVVFGRRLVRLTGGI